MKYENLSETLLIKTVSETDTEANFEIEGLYAGYGVTVGNALRRVLLSSLPGAAITQVKIKGANHEFTTIPGVVEDIVEIALNLKRVRLRMYSEEPQVLSLKAKGDGEVKAGDIGTNAQVDVITPQVHIATISEKSTEFDMELTVEAGRGYVAAEAIHVEKLPVGVIALDAIFSPVTMVNFSVENMRVGDRTDFNRLRMSVRTDGSITPSQAVKRSAEILQEHFMKIGGLTVVEPAPKSSVEEEKGKTEKKKKSVKAKKK